MLRSEVIDLSNYSARHFDRGASRLKEAVWCVVNHLFFTTRWPFPSSLRRYLLRLFGAQIGRGVIIRSGVNITFPWRLTIGDHTWLGEDVRILNLTQVTIGSSVCLSQQAFLCTGSHNFHRPDFQLIVNPITIEDSCWIAARAFIGPGVTIGSGSLIGATATVMKPVASGTVIHGARPAQLDSHTSCAA